MCVCVNVNAAVPFTVWTLTFCVTSSHSKRSVCRTLTAVDLYGVRGVGGISDQGFDLMFHNGEDGLPLLKV